MPIKYIQLSPHHFDAIIDLGNAVHGINYLDDSSMLDLYQRSWSNNINTSWVAVLDATSMDELPCDALQSDAQASLAIPIGGRQSKRNTPDGYLIGFRLTIAADRWVPDKWCSPEQWDLPSSQICYFKCNTVDAEFRGRSIGSTLLKKSIETSVQQGARAGIAHIWKASPNNSAFLYFSACGGKLIKEHPNKWQENSIEDSYDCPICGQLCYCTAAEMLLRFDEKNA